MRQRTALAGAAVAALGLAVAPVAISQAGKPKPVKKVVKIGDNFFTPDKLKLPKGSTVTWRWPKQAGDTHDVKLRSGPKGVKKFHSQFAASDYSFRRKLTKPGLYKVICTIHQGMDMTIRIKR